MARRRRPKIHGGIYHVMNRGNRKALIFEDDRDRRRFTRILIDTATESGVHVACGTQMSTHFHLIVETPLGNISEFMQQLEGRFAQYINWRHKRVGHVFQGTFRSVVVENDIHFFTTIWYVLANPCEAGLCHRFEDWPWSTYAATIGLKPVPSYLSIEWLQTLFPADTFGASQRLFRECMESRDPVAAYLLAVDPTSSAAVRSYVFSRLRQMQQPFSYRELVRPPLDHLFAPHQLKAERDRAIRSAKIVHGYTLAEIAKSVHLHPDSVSEIFRTESRSG